MVASGGVLVRSGASGFLSGRFLYSIMKIDSCALMTQGCRNYSESCSGWKRGHDNLCANGH